MSCGMTRSTSPSSSTNPAVIIGSLPAGIEFFSFSIVHASSIPRHGPQKDVIYRIEDDRDAAEVPPQVDTALHGLFITAEGLVFIEEQRRVGQAEAVDALLDIADHEAVIVARDETGNEFLDTVRILVLIDEDFFILTAQFFRRC